MYKRRLLAKRKKGDENEIHFDGKKGHIMPAKVCIFLIGLSSMFEVDKNFSFLQNQNELNFSF